MIRIFEITTICPDAVKGAADVQSTYRVSALDAEKAIAKAKKRGSFHDDHERVMSVVLLASTDL